MSEAVLDASALLAYLNEEPGAEAVEEALARAACIGAANWAEVLSIAAENGVDPEAFIREIKARGILDQTLEVVPLLPEDGPVIARLRPLTKAAGLSLGDRACLALGLTAGAAGPDHRSRMAEARLGRRGTYRALKGPPDHPRFTEQAHGRAAHLGV